MYKSGENLLCAQAIDFFACLILALTLTIGLSLSGCATTKTSEEQASAINKADPYENFNRKVYGFNDTVDHYVAKPIADGYKYITPDFMETGVSNFFNNLKSINVVLNDILQENLNKVAAIQAVF